MYQAKAGTGRARYEALETRSMAAEALMTALELEKCYLRERDSRREELVKWSTSRMSPRTTAGVCAPSEAF